MPIFTTSDHIRIAYEIFGPFKGKPFVLIHGFASTYMTNWIQTNWINTLIEAGFRVIVFNNRGHGDSDKPYEISSYAMPRMVQDVLELLDHIGIQEPSYIMGYSMGGMMTLMAAALYPERWLKGIAAGVGANLLQSETMMKRVSHAFLSEEKERMGLVSNDAVIKMFYDFACHNQQDLRALGMCLQAIPRPFPFDTLPSIRIPILLAVGDQDTHMGPADELLPLIPNATLVTIPGRDHMKAVGDKVYKEAVLSFLH